MESSFVISSPSLALCPPPDLSRVEIAIVGRSNVGKSSLLNLLTQRKQLAKTSQTPGKTRLINFFTVGTHWTLVDLPGYGYARVSKQQQAQWGQQLSAFLQQRETLACTLLLVDGKIGPQPMDHQMSQWLHYHQRPFITVLTKTDKLRKQHEQNAIWQQAVGLGGAAVFATSATKRTGADAVWQWLQTTYLR
jgi:GTP-binding protein